jgi:excisionase family DNA binding protein
VSKQRLLTVQEVAERLGTSVAFPRRLILERRIRFVKLGRLVRIPESALAAMVEAGTVEPVERGRARRRQRRRDGC